MPSPDISAYIDLTLDDRSAGDLVDDALARAAVMLPDWIPREGQTESVLIEALAAIGSELVFALNRLPSSTVQALLGVFGVTRDQGGPASTSLTFTVNDQLGHVIPAGTRVSLDLGAAVSPILLATDHDLAIGAGQSSGTVTATATVYGTAANGTPAGMRAALIDAVAAVDSVITVAPVAGGRDAEDDSTYLARGLVAFTRLTSTLLRANDFEAFALGQPYVYRARALDLYNPASGNAPGGDVGHVTIADLGPAGAPVSVANKAALQAAAVASASAGLTVHVIDATITTVDVAATVRRFATADGGDVADAVTADLQTYLSPDTWGWSTTVRYNDLIALIDGSAGVDFVVSIAQPPGDVALAGYATLVQAGQITITVQDPAA